MRKISNHKKNNFLSCPKIVCNIKPFSASHFIMLLAGILLMSGCCMNKSTYSLPSKVKEFVHFNTGTLWVYRDQNSHFDSIVVLESDVSISKVNAESCDEAERIYMKYSSTVNGVLFASLSADLAREDNCIANSLPWKWEWFTSSIYVQETSNDTMIVNGVDYTNIIICKMRDITQVSNEYPSKYFLSKNIGIIKKVYPDSSVWELTEYKINK